MWARWVVISIDSCVYIAACLLRNVTCDSVEFTFFVSVCFGIILGTRHVTDAIQYRISVYVASYSVTSRTKLIAFVFILGALRILFLAIDSTMLETVLLPKLTVSRFDCHIQL